MMNDIDFEKKFSTIDDNESLPMPKYGDVVNDGNKDLVVISVDKIDGKDLVLLYEEDTKKLGLYEVTNIKNGLNYNLVNDNIIFGKVILNIINKNNKGEK